VPMTIAELLGCLHGSARMSPPDAVDDPIQRRHNVQSWLDPALRARGGDRPLTGSFRPSSPRTSVPDGSIALKNSRCRQAGVDPKRHEGAWDYPVARDPWDVEAYRCVAVKPPQEARSSCGSSALAF